MPNLSANFSQRLFAYNIDLTVLVLLLWPMSLWIANNTIFYWSSFGVICLYHAVMESSVWQGTLGKRYSKLIVETDSEERLNLFQAIYRVLMKFLSLALLFGGFFMIYFRKDKKGLHDLIVGTKVVCRD
ncbi:MULTISPECIES: RDD family protein [Reichenbachiella]|uniref:RDD family protein n=1 Tax=Reichenbachiella agariperforans TaxID=156994 RepID=A0A1M6JHS1_REIAG|nr:RDD family protein [Reichenbachiella agariperforans]MBU2913200.1 RDD family protein [Reichenbachiella agariperforans]SHJ46172.1 RDD family protein [Reichenbachiella agariperforans]